MKSPNDAGPPRASNLVELLRRRALREPGRRAYTFLAEADEAETTITYAELDARARAVAAHLQSLGRAGERALLLYPPGLDYVAAFFGCLYAGVIAVPAYPPRQKRNIARLRAIMADTQAAFALTTAAVASKLQTPAGDFGLKEVVWVATDEIAVEAAAEWREARPSADGLAYLQYTSGSTAVPKGVMVTHANVLHNSEYIRDGFGHTRDSVSLTWLPHFHDMGLIDGIIQPLYGGFAAYLMSPTSFLQQPARWLRAVGQYGVTHTGGPNFAYDLCARKVRAEQRAALDLSSWSVAYNGAEPVRRETLERFAAAFAACGFSPRAFYPAYGLAEATLKVSGGRRQGGAAFRALSAKALEQNRVAEVSDEAEDARALVGSGQVSHETVVAVVNPESSARCAPDEVGEIWVSGPGVALGYWRREKETAETFRAYTSDMGEGPFLRTGDLGFVSGGELFITGRLKDLIIIRGRNHYPQDVELVVERSHPALRAGCGAAFSVEMGGEERLVVVQEADTRTAVDFGAVIEAIRNSVAAEFEIQPAAVVLLAPGGVFKTSSGKIQRRACRESFLKNGFEVVAEWRAGAEAGEVGGETGAPSPRDAGSLEDWLRARLAAKLGVEPSAVDAGRPLVGYGLDSLMATELAYDIESDLGVVLPMTRLLEGATVGELAAVLLEQLGASGDAGGTSLAAAPRSAADSPLSYGQQALWFLQQLAPESAAYNIARAMLIRGALDPDALARAFGLLAARHESLRMTFGATQGEPTQRVSERVEFFAAADARDWPEGALRERLNEEAHRPFDLERGPLVRVGLFQASEREHVLLLVAHHIVVDFWSLAVLLEELGALYEAERAGGAASLGPPKLRYADYVGWQNEMLAGRAGERLWEYWRARLDGAPSALDLPLDHTRPTAQTYRGASLPFRLDADLTRPLKALGHARGATLYMTLLAAFYALLHRYTGQSDIVVGSPTSGRTRAEFSGVVGYFVNPLALRADLAGDPPFEDFLGRVRRAVLGDFEHQDYPFALLVKHLHPERDLSRSPVFQVMFILQKSHVLDKEGIAAFALGEEGASLSLGSLALESVRLEQRVAQFDVTLMMTESGDDLLGSWEYNSDLFEADTIGRMTGHFERLLAAVASDPDRRLSELPLLTPAEREQLIVGYNDTRADYPAGLCLHQLVERQAERTPDAEAVLFEDERLSYGELDERAESLAAYLRAEGVGPESVVAVCVERSVEMVVALLGVLKAGGAYLPLDPQYPRERVSFMLEDACVPLVLTQERLRATLPETGARVFCIDAARPEPPAAGRDAARHAPRPAPDNLAYVIYTSGSTGRPKGIQIPHRAVVNFMHSMRASLGVTGDDTLLSVTTLSFDIAALELYLPLIVGARLVVVSSEVAADGMRLSESLSDSGATVMQATPATWRMLLDAGWRGDGRLKILCGGEALPKELAGELLARGDCLWNLYGPTETTIWSAAARVEDGARPISIGRPIANTQLYLLDANLRPAPVGVPGELYIGGDGLARGYSGRPDLTAEKFIPNPFSDVPGARMYRTGDLVRRLPDGSIEYLGRLDHQVKIRGFRIELGEVESALAAHPAVRECVVVAQAAAGGGQRLVAYYVAAGGELPTAELRAHLRGRLPEYMTPSAFVALEALPLTANGKVDRKRLPAAGDAGARARGEYVAPRGEVEEVLARIWAEVLGMERVGARENFFELGGDSILSIQVVARAGREGLGLAARDVFEHQTVEALARAARRSDDADGGRDAREESAGEVALVPTQQRFFELHAAEPHLQVESVLLETPPDLDAQTLEAALAYLVERHDALRLSFERDGSGWRQAYSTAARAIPLARRDLSTLDASEQVSAFERAAAEARAAFSLSDSPLMRAVLFARGRGLTGRLLLSAHELIVDAVSWRVLIEDLSAASTRGGRGESSARARAAPFGRWAGRLRALADSDEPIGELAYWTAEERRAVEALPTDLVTDGAPSSAPASAVQVSLDAEEADALLSLVPQRYRIEPREMLLAALARVLGEWGGRTRVLVELIDHERHELGGGLDAARTVGCLKTVCPVLLEAGGADDDGQALKRVKESLRSLPRRGVGYGLLRYGADGHAAEQLRAMPQPGVSFSYLGRTFDDGPEPLTLRRAPEDGATHEGRGARPARPLEVRAWADGGGLHLRWSYDAGLYLRPTVEGFAARHAAALRGLVAYCLSAREVGYTPSDFSDVRLDQKELDDILAQISTSLE